MEHNLEELHSPLALEFGEHIIKSIPRHPVNLLPVLTSSVITVLFSFYASYYLGLHANRLPIGLNADVGLLTLILVVLDVLAVLILVLGLYVYRQNRLLLTNIHLIEVTQNGLFDRTLSKLSLQQLQDVRGSRKGLFATLFNYGELLMETAAEKENFLFRPVGGPIETAELINDAREQYMREHNVSTPNLSDKAPTQPQPTEKN